MSADPRQTASTKIAELISLLKNHPAPSTAGLIEEAEALARAVSAFHMEGIRFRMFNVDRGLVRAAAEVPPGAPALLEEVRHHLEAAGFHTRSHQAPG